MASYRGRPWGKTPEQRFWERIEKTSTCWLWLGGKQGNGHPQFRVNGRDVQVQRFAYELLVGPIPEGYEIDHLCRVRHCMNPAHLEAVTHRENTLRGIGPTAMNARKTHCKRGHPLTPENLYMSGQGGSRRCKTCTNERAKRKRYRLRKRDNDRGRR